MKVWNKATIASLAILAIAIGSVHPAAAATRRKKSASPAAAPATGDNAKISSDPGSATVKENKVLKWTHVDPPSTGDISEYEFRGVLVDIQPEKDADGKEIKNQYVLKFDVLEVVENEERDITFDIFSGGVTIKRRVVNKDFWKEVKKGKLLDVRQWYEVVDQGAIGHAKMVGYIFHQDITPQPGGPAIYIKKPGLYMEEYRNALNAMAVADDKGSGDPELKDALDALASSASDPAVKAKAGELLSSMYGAQPSGKPMLTPGGTTAPAAKKKKG